MEGRDGSSTKRREPRAAVVGGGPTGTLASLVLRKHGFQVELIEKQADPRHRKEGKCFEVPLLLNERGMEALQRVGAKEEVRRSAIEINGQTVHLGSMEVKREPFGDEGDKLHCLSGKAILKVLLDRADSKGVHLDFESRLVDLDIEQGLLHLERNGEHRQMRVVGGREPQMQVELIVGADGGQSMVREQMKKVSRMNFSRSFRGHGYKTVIIPPHNGMFALDPNTLHMWPRKNFGLLALPNPDHSFTCVICLPFHGENSFETMCSDGEVFAFLKREFPDVAVCVMSSPLRFLEQPIVPMSFSEAFPAHAGSKALLVGKAACEVLPIGEFHDNIGLEDCLLLDDLIGEYGTGRTCLETVFRKYSTISLDRFELMRPLSSDMLESVIGLSPNRFLQLKHMVEGALIRALPRSTGLTTARSAVSFTSLPYGQVKSMSRKKDIGMGLVGICLVASITAGTSYAMHRRWKYHEPVNQLHSSVGLT